MKKKIRVIILIVYVLIAGALIFLSIKNDNKIVETSNPNKKVLENKVLENHDITNSNQVINSKQEIKSAVIKQPVVAKISSTIIVGDLKLEESFEAGKSVYDILKMEKEKGKLNLVSKEFSGMGFFVSEIGSLKENKNKHLIYFVNGKSPSVGISAYILKDKDVVSWELK